MLRALAGLGRPEISRQEIEAEVRQEIAGQIASRLLALAVGGGAAAPSAKTATGE
ncbi:hypothetical protein D3C83_201450 [compost metagenome]